MKLSVYIGVVISLFSIWSYGQSTRIEISDFLYRLNGDEDICQGNVRLTAYFTDGRLQDFFYKDEYNRERTYTEEDFVVQLFGIVESIRIYAYVRERTGGRCNNGRGTVVEHDVVIPVNPNPCTQGIYHEYIRNGGDFEVGSELRIGYRVIPRPDITRVSSTDIAGYEDNLSVQATEGYNNSVYNWQYSIDLGEWHNINVPNSNRLNIIPSSFLDPSLIGQRIYFRTSACDNIGSDNFVYYDLRRSAPHIINTHTEPVSCYDSQDGQIRITFDRPLEPGDNLNITVADMSRRAAGSDEYGRPNYEIVEGVGLENITELDENNSIVLINLPPSATDFRVDILGFYNGSAYYSGAENHSEPVTISRPEAPVSFQITDVVNVWCNNGDGVSPNNDGEIHLQASGGNPGTYQFSITGENRTGPWQNFSENDTHNITGLRPGNYNIRVRKYISEREVYCDAKEQTVVDGETLLGEIIVLEQEILQSEIPLQLMYEDHVEPTAYGFTNGSITARVFGGTPVSGNSYNFEWRNSNGTLMTDTSTSYVPEQGYFITLNNIPAGTYSLTVTDGNFNQATFIAGCTVVESEFELEQPDPLQVIFEETNSISCNSENTNNDPFSDGELTAHVTGGVVLGLFDNNGLPYFYTWKKRIEGQWVVLEAETDPVLSGISHGEYALNVRDANGIILGDYEHNILVRETDSTVTIVQPELLDISHTKNNPTCAQGNNGNATIEISGGTPPYSVSWSNGASTYSVENLINGIYLVYVTDSKGCRAEEEIVLEQPDGMQLQIASSIPPTCYLGNDGAIEVITRGGTPPYTYLWDTGETTSYISNLEAGTYRVQVTDAQGCVTFFEETLEETPPLVVGLGEGRTLCDWQWLTLDIAIDDPGAVYEWVSDNGFASDSPVVELTEPGIYRATITTSKGCTGFDEIEVKTSIDPIDAHFVLSTQAFAMEETSLVNISSPVGDRVEWTVPEGVDILYKANNKLIVLFKEAGIYDINLRSYQGDCYLDYTKNIIVEQAAKLQDIGDSNNPFIEEFIVYPNPSNGSFKIKLSLAEEANISVKVISLITSSVMDTKMEGGARDFLLDYNLQHMPSGVYLLLLETPKGDEIRKLVFD